MKYRKKTGKGELDQDCAQSMESERSPPVITVDYEKYEHFLEDSDLSEEQKREFLQTLWEVICTFVSLGFGVHPVQQAQNACGKAEETAPKPALSMPDRVKYTHKVLGKKFEGAADLETDSAAERVEG